MLTRTSDRQHGPAEPPSGSRPARGVTAASLAATMMAAALLQASIGAFSPLVTADLGLSRTGLGVLLGGYYLAAAVASAPLGRLVDRLGSRRGLALVLIMAVLGTAMAALSTGALLLGAALLVSGLAVAAANPATNLALAATPPPHGTVMGVKQSGVQLAPVVAGVLLAPIAAVLGWRAALGVASGLSAVLLVAVYVSWRAVPRQTGRNAGVAASGGSGSRSLRLLAAYALCMGVGYAGVMVYLALFAHEVLLFSEHRAAVLVAVVGGSAVAARIGWSVLVERARGWLGGERAVLLLIGAIAVAASLGLMAAQHLAAGVVWAAAIGIGVSAAAWNGVVMLVLVRDSGAPGSVGSASGRVQGAFFLGLALGPPVFGAAVDHAGTYTIGWIWTAVSFTAAFVAACALGRGERQPPGRRSHAEMRGAR